MAGTEFNTKKKKFIMSMIKQMVETRFSKQVKEFLLNSHC